jgi:hypothetical protein
VFTLYEFADPFPFGVVQSVAALACNPDAVPVPVEAATDGPVVRFAPAASVNGSGSNVHSASVITALAGWAFPKTETSVRPTANHRPFPNTPSRSLRIHGSFSKGGTIEGF